MSWFDHPKSGSGNITIRLLPLPTNLTLSVNRLTWWNRRLHWKNYLSATCGEYLVFNSRWSPDELGLILMDGAKEKGAYYSFLVENNGVLR
jgi:hypothetical protein